MAFKITDIGKKKFLETMPVKKTNEFRIEFDQFNSNYIRLVLIADGLDIAYWEIEIPVGGSITFQGVNWNIDGLLSFKPS